MGVGFRLLCQSLGLPSLGLSSLGLPYLGLSSPSQRADRLGRPPSVRPSPGGGGVVFWFYRTPFLRGGGGGGAETQYPFARYVGGVVGAVPSVSRRADRPFVGGGLVCDCRSVPARERGALCLLCDKLRPLCGPKSIPGFGVGYLGSAGRGRGFELIFIERRAKIFKVDA